MLYYSTKNGEIRCHQFVEIATNLRDIRKSVIGHMLMHKSLLSSYYIKLKSHPSVRLQFFDQVDSAVDARISVKLDPNEAPVFWEHEVCF